MTVWITVLLGCECQVSCLIVRGLWRWARKETIIRAVQVSPSHVEFPVTASLQLLSNGTHLSVFSTVLDRAVKWMFSVSSPFLDFRLAGHHPRSPSWSMLRCFQHGILAAFTLKYIVIINIIILIFTATRPSAAARITTATTSVASVITSTTVTPTRCITIASAAASSATRYWSSRNTEEVQEMLKKFKKWWSLRNT